MVTSRNRDRSKGFTIIELLVVLSIMGLLAGIVAVRVQRTLQRAKEARLKHDLRVMRDTIEQFKVDQKVYPQDLVELVEAEYLRTVPVDVFTGSDETWEFEFEELDEEALELDSYAQPGIVYIFSGAEGIDLDGVAYRDY